MSRYKDPLRHRWQTRGPWDELGPPPCFIHLEPCFYAAAALNSLPLDKEWLHFYSLKITFSHLKATSRLMWPLVKWVWHPCKVSVGFLGHHIRKDSDTSCLVQGCSEIQKGPKLLSIEGKSLKLFSRASPSPPKLYLIELFLLFTLKKLAKIYTSH